MNQYEVNRIRSKMRKLNLDDEFIDLYVNKLIRNREPYVIASKTIDRWEKRDSGQFVLQALACGLIAAVVGGWFAVVQWVDDPIMNDATAIALFSVGMASTLSVLLVAFRRTYNLEKDRKLMKRMRRRLNRMLLNQKS